MPRRGGCALLEMIWRLWYEIPMFPLECGLLEMDARLRNRACAPLRTVSGPRGPRRGRVAAWRRSGHRRTVITANSEILFSASFPGRSARSWTPGFRACLGRAFPQFARRFHPHGSTPLLGKMTGNWKAPCAVEGGCGRRTAMTCNFFTRLVDYGPLFG